MRSEATWLLIVRSDLSCDDPSSPTPTHTHIQPFLLFPSVNFMCTLASPLCTNTLWGQRTEMERSFVTPWSLAGEMADRVMALPSRVGQQSLIRQESSQAAWAWPNLPGVTDVIQAQQFKKWSLISSTWWSCSVLPPLG